jgi:S1-C subfamily serine protease
LYIPPAWITRNAALIDDPKPMGTGERDYALLYVTESMTSEPLPARFPALAFDNRPLALSTVGSQVVAAGYPAANLRTSDNNLIPTRSATQITELYTFGSNLADVFSIGGTPVGAEGASGGPIVDSSGAVIGLIVTRGDDSSDGAGSLRAITLSHIDRTITEETGFSLERNIGGNLPFRAEVFRTTMTPFLLTLLEQERRRP